jgi:hypothetical protein
MSVSMKNSRKKVLPFPTPPEEPTSSTIVVQIGRNPLRHPLGDRGTAAGGSRGAVEPTATNAIAKIVTSSWQSCTSTCHSPNEEA